jgi:hypothetical protein
MDLSDGLSSLNSLLIFESKSATYTLSNFQMVPRVQDSLELQFDRRPLSSQNTSGFKFPRERASDAEG